MVLDRCEVRLRMIELLAAITSDPLSLPLWMVVTAAAGMYPVGLMLGAPCSPCCGCGVCAQGSLPETITVNISGYEDEVVPGPYLTWLTFDSCVGSGAEGRIAAPGITPGPIESVEVTNGGGGYAVVGRVAPILSVAGGSGEGADVEFSLSQSFDEACGLIPTWSVESLTVNDGGAGYANGEQLTVVADAGDAVVSPASLTISTTIGPPTITATVSAFGSGGGAVLSATVAEDPFNPGYWVVASVSVVDGGSGYTNDDGVSFTADTAGGDFVAWEASGAITIDEDGVVTDVTVIDGGAYYNDDGVIASITVDQPGEYYREDVEAPAIVPEITVTINESAWTPSNGAGGILEAVVDDDPASGTFGQVTAVTVVNAGDDYIAYDETVEQCCQDHYNGKTVVLQNGGDSESIWNGFSKTPQQQAKAKCRFVHKWCGAAYSGGSPLNPTTPAPAMPYVMVEYRGPNEYPLVWINDFGGCEALLTSESLVSNCSDFSFTATNENGVTAAVSPGGEYDETYLAEDGLCGQRCHPCCRGHGEPPCEVEVVLSSDIDEPMNLVLSRDTFESYGPNYHEDSRRTMGWAIQLPGGGARVTVFIKECDYDPEVAPNCDNCWKQCETRAAVYYGHPFNIGSCTLRYSSDRCVNCEDTTASGLCAPQAGVYVCDDVYNPSGFCNDGRTAWTVEVV